MNIVLWILQIIVAFGFLAGGTMKLFFPLERLAKQMKWVPDLPPALVRLIGLAEILGAIGLILPGATGIMPWLTIFAAFGLTLIMVLAVGFHLRRGEKLGNSPMTLALSAAVLVGHFLLGSA
jgi:putative oxidoreductase